LPGSILIVGAGGLGAPVIRALARAGANHLTVVDPEKVELSNLARQTIYRTSDIGTYKVQAAMLWTARRYPSIVFEGRAIALDESNARTLVAGINVVIDATDSPIAKFLINDTCIATRTPFVYGGVIGMNGQVMTVFPGETACLRCIFETPPDNDEIASCREAGIIGPIAGAIGEIQALESMRALRAEKLYLAGKILTYDAREPARVRVTQVAARSGCECGAFKTHTLGAQTA
jgi:molybdopterin-synthase adenylyltransferase